MANANPKGGTRFAVLRDALRGPLAIGGVPPPKTAPLPEPWTEEDDALAAARLAALDAMEGMDARMAALEARLAASTESDEARAARERSDAEIAALRDQVAVLSSSVDQAASAAAEAKMRVNEVRSRTDRLAEAATWVEPPQSPRAPLLPAPGAADPEEGAGR